MVVLTVVLGAMMQFMSMLQQRYTREQRAAGVGQTGKTVMELLALDVGQAGFYPGRTTTASADIPVGSQTVVLGDATGIYVGSKLVVDRDPGPPNNKQEIVEVTAVNYTTNAITATFLKPHTAGASGVPVRLTEVPYADGVLYRNPDTVPAISSTSETLRLMGDFWGDRTLRYIEYRFTPSTLPTDCQGVLVRSDSCVPSTSLACTTTTQTPAVVVADNLCNAAGPPPGNPNPVFRYDDPFNPGTSLPVLLGPFTYVRYLTVTLIMRTPQPVEGPGGGGPRTLEMRQTFVPRNISYALRVSQDSLQELIPDRPKDSGGNYTVPVPP